MALRFNNPLGICYHFIQRGDDNLQVSRDICHYKNLLSGFAATFSVFFGLMDKRFRNNTVSALLKAFLNYSMKDLEPRLTVVCEQAQLNKNDIVRKQDKNRLSRIIWALANYECDRKFSIGLIENAYELARYNDTTK